MMTALDRTSRRFATVGGRNIFLIGDPSSLILTGLILSLLLMKFIVGTV